MSAFGVKRTWRSHRKCLLLTKADIRTLQVAKFRGYHVPQAAPLGPTMRRREFISLLGGAAAAWPLAARGQRAGRLRRIGIIVGGGPSPALAGFAQGMQKLGYVEGRDFAIEWRFAEGNYERHREFAADLVRQNVDVIVCTTSALPAVQQV